MHHKHLIIFSKKPPVALFVPQTRVEVIIFPQMIEIDGKKVVLFKGFIEEFQVFLNLKKGSIQVRGSVDGNFFEYEVLAKNQAIHLVGKKNAPSKKLLSVDVKESEIETMHFGVNKKKQLERIFERRDLKEILPIWYHLSQVVCVQKTVKSSFYDVIEAMKTKKSHDHIGQELLKRFFFLFPYRLVPSSEDLLKYGYQFRMNKAVGFELLKESQALLRSLFFEENKNALSILPHLPKELVFGRIENLTSTKGKLDIRFSKKSPFSLRFVPSKSQQLTIHFPKQWKRCRVRNSQKERGVKISLPLQLPFEKGKVYLIDRFEK